MVMAMAPLAVMMAYLLAPASGSSATAEDDPDLAFMRAHTVQALASLQSTSRPPRHFARASDDGRPAAYAEATARDLATLLHFAADALGSAGLAAAEADARVLLAAPRTGREPPAELPSRAWLLGAVANRTGPTGTALLCAQLPTIWAELQATYRNGSVFRDGLAFSAAAAVGALETVLTSGHNTLLSLLHVQALDSLSAMASVHGCGADALAMQAARATIVAALGGPMLWNDATGMFRPSSGNCVNLTDVWASALAVEVGAVTGGRAGRVVAWFGAHWPEVVQDGQIRHLPATKAASSGMPEGEYWPATTTWEYQTHQNGGYWAAAAGWVLPVIARSDAALGARLVREAIDAVRRDGGQHETVFLLHPPLPSVDVSMGTWRGRQQYDRSRQRLGAARRRAARVDKRPVLLQLRGRGVVDLAVHDAVPEHRGAAIAVGQARHSAAPPTTFTCSTRVGVSVELQRGCHQSDSLANGQVLRGVRNFGASTASVFGAATRILGGAAPTPPADAPAAAAPPSAPELGQARKQTVILLHPPLPSSRCSNRDNNRGVPSK